MAGVKTKWSYDTSTYKRLVYVLLLLAVIVVGYWGSIRFMTRDLVDHRKDLSPVMYYHVSDPFNSIRRDESRSSDDFQALANWPKRMAIDESLVYWFRFSMKEAGMVDPEEEYFIEMRETGQSWTLFSMQLYIEDKGELKELGKTGYEVPQEERSYNRGGFVLQLERNELPEGSDIVYVRTSVRNGFYPHFYVWNDQGSLERFKVRINGMVFFNFGVLLSILVYLVVLLTVLKNRILGYFFVYVLLWLFLVFSFWLAQEGFWPIEARRLLSLVGILGTTAAYFVLFVFTHRFLDLEKYFPKMSRAFPFFTFMNVLGLAMMLVAVFLDHDKIVMMVFTLRDIVFSIFLIGTGILAIFAGIRQALFFNASFVLILGSQIVNHLIRVEALPPWPFPFSELPASDNVLVLGTLLFSFAIADNMRQVQRQRDQAQEKSLDTLEQLNKLETEAKEALEIQVKEKTRHLEVEIERAQNAEVALGKALEGETKTSKAKSAFLANMSHELRTPLNAILGYAQLIGNPDYDLEKRKRAGQVIEKSGNHLLELINDVLNLSKVEAGRIELEPEAYALREMLQDLVNMMELNARQKGLELLFHCDDSVPDIVRGDRRYLRQILINLLGNAIKFTTAGTIELKVRLKSTESETVCMSVIDTGRGIATDKFESIFEPFKQVAGEKETVPGTGLGLAISRRLARLMGGDLTVQSTLKKGSHFLLNLPLPKTNETPEIVASDISPTISEPKLVANQSSSTDVVLPPASTLKILKEHVNSGYVSGIREVLKEMDGQSEFSSFVSLVQQYLNEFDMAGITKLIENSSEQPGE